MRTDQATPLRRWLATLGRRPAHTALAAPCPRARRVAIVSGKGGVGKTNLAGNLGIALSQMRRRVVVVGADLGLANIEVLLGLSPCASLADVLSGDLSLPEVLCDGPAGIRVLPGGAGIPELARLSADEQDAVVALLQQLEASADLILVDTAAGIGDNVLTWACAMDEVLVVTTPEPGAITDAYAMVKVLSQAARCPRLGLVINQATHTSEAASTEAALVRVALRLLGVTIHPYGVIPQDETVQRAVREQVPVLLAWPRSPASVSIRRIAHLLLEREVVVR